MYVNFRNHFLLFDQNNDFNWGGGSGSIYLAIGDDIK